MKSAGKERGKKGGSTTNTEHTAMDASNFELMAKMGVLRYGTT